MINMYDTSSYFFGVVEDREDPKQLGRVRVRVFGLHPFDKAQGDYVGIETEDLPWMTIIMPPGSPSVGGYGQAPVGLVPGSHVFGLFLDEYKINGVVMGSFYGVQTDLGNDGEGFRDANGVFPEEPGTSTPTLSKGGSVGGSDQSVILQDGGYSVGVNPDGELDEEENPDDNPGMSLATMLKRDEGVRLGWYSDSLGYPTIGIGHLIIAKETKDLRAINRELSNLTGRTINNGRITMEEVDRIFENDRKKVLRQIQSHAFIGPIYAQMNASRKLALANMAFQMGIGGLAKFKRTLGLLQASEWKKAHDAGKESLWARQTKGRANRVCKILMKGNLESYGVPVSTARMSRMMARKIENERPSAPTLDPKEVERDPEAPFTPEDSRIMFVEPEAAYKGEYPYVQVTTTEGGHTTEIDNTPGKERYRYMHPSGTYTEIDGEGRTVNKITADRFDIIEGDDHLLVQGDGKLVVSGNCKVYIMGNVQQTIDGNVLQHIRGDVGITAEKDVKVEILGNLEANVKGNSDIKIEGNSDILVQGDATVHVEGNGVATYDGNYDMNVKGNMTTTVDGQRTDNVTGDWDRKAATTSDIAEGDFVIDGTRIDVGL